MGRQHATVGVDERAPARRDLPLAREAGKLTIRLDRVSHPARHARVPERQQSAVRIEGQLAAAREIARARTLRRPAARREARLLDEDGERDRERVVDREVVDVGALQAGLPEWVEVNDKEMRGVFKAIPAREDVLPDVNENLVVELYSK